MRSAHGFEGPFSSMTRSGAGSLLSPTPMVVNVAEPRFGNDGPG